MGFGPVMLVLQEDSDPTAQGLFRFLCTKEFVHALLMLRDTLPHLAAVQRILQSQKLDPIAAGSLYWIHL